MAKKKEDRNVYNPVERVWKSLRMDNIWIWILKLLMEEDQYSYTLRKLLNERFNFEPATVTTYAVLYRLERSGFVEQTNNAKFPNRKYYKITDMGINELKEAERTIKRTLLEIYEDMPNWPPEEKDAK